MDTSKKIAPKSETTTETKPARPKLTPVDHVAYVASALMRLQSRLRIAERAVVGSERASLIELRKEVLDLYVKADTVRGALEMPDTKSVATEPLGSSKSARG